MTDTPERPYRVLLIGSAPPQLEQPSDLDLRPENGAPWSTGPDVIVVGIDTDQIAVVQRCHARHPDALVILVVAPGDPNALRRNITFTPSIPSDLEVVDADQNVRAAVEQAGARALVRQAHRASLAQASAALGHGGSTMARPTLASLGTVLDNAPLGVLVTDTAGVLLTWNAQAATILHSTPRVIDRPVMALFSDATLVESLISDAARDPESAADPAPVVVELAGRPDAHLELTAVGADLDDGHRVVVILVLDVTVRRAAEDARDALDQRLRLSQRSLEFQLRVTDVVLAASGYDETLRRLASSALPTLGDVCIVDLLENGTTRRLTVQHADPSLQPVADALAQWSPPGAVEGHPAFDAERFRTPMWQAQVNDDWLRSNAYSPAHLDILRELQITGYIAVPLVLTDDVLGVVTLLSTGDRPPFVPDDVELAEQLAARVAHVASRTRRFDREHRIAEELQHSLLGKLPDVAGLSLAARYAPAGQDAQVGGDWYDAFVLPEPATALVIGDVVGHDLAAVTRMGQLRNALRGLAWTHGHNPSEVLDEMGKLNRSFGIAQLATIIYGLLSPHPNGLEFRWSNAGHPPPVLVDATGNVRVLDHIRSPVIGVRPRVPRPTGRVLLSPGTTLLFYTDGLVESRTRSLDHGIDALTDLVHAQHALPVGQLCDELVHALGQAAEDDIAILAVRVLDEV